MGLPTLDIGLPGWTLRAWREADADALALHANDTEVWRWMSDSFPHPYTTDIARHWVTRGHIDFGGDNWAIALDDRALGGCGIHGGDGQLRCNAEVAHRPRAFEIAQALLDGFNRHYRLFRATSRAAKQRFEQADWLGQQRAQRERIEFYDQRVNEAAERCGEFNATRLSMDTWQQVKLHYIGLLVDHHQPELAETFFNSVTTKILHRSYFHNDFIFVRPAVSTEYIENDEPAATPTYRAYYPTRDNAARHADAHRHQLPARGEFEDLARDVDHVARRRGALLGGFRPRTNFQIQVLSSPVLPQQGRLRGGQDHQRLQRAAVRPAHPARPAGKLVIDAALFGEDDLLLMFSFARAYFMVDMEVPSAYVQFLRSLMPRKPRSRALQRLGLQKHGKNLFYRDFLFHLRHSSDKLPHRARHQGHGDAGVRPAVLPLRVQGDQGLLPAAEGHHARADQGQVPAGQAARPRRPHGRHAGVQQRGLSALALRARAGGRAEALLPQPAGEETATARHQAPLHRAAHDPAEHLPAGRHAPRRWSTRSSSTATPSRTWWPPTSSPATCCGRTSASRATARWCSTTTTRSSTSPTATSARAHAAQRGRRDERRDLVFGGPKRRLPRDLRPLPAGQRRGARGLHEAPCRPAGRRVLAGHKERIKAGHVHDVFPYDSVAGAELFTGNNLIAMAWAGGHVRSGELLRHWALVCVANAVGAVGLALLVWLSGHATMHGGAVGRAAVAIATFKAELPWAEAFFRGVLCNVLVCMAVWMAFAGRSVADKAVAIVFPVTAFVAAGFEHSVANFYFFPLAMLLGAPLAAGDVLANLVAVIAGNLVGGSVPIVIVSAARTPIGGLLGDFANLAGLGAGRRGHPAAVERAGVPGDAVDEVLLGNCLMAGQGQAPARQAVRKAGLPRLGRRRDAVQDVRLGMRAMMFAHDMLAAGSADVMVAGGMESMTNAPHLMFARKGVKYGAAPDVRPHGDGRPGRRLRARQGHGRVRRTVRHQVRLHPRGAGPVRHRLHHSAPSRPTRTAASTGRWRPSRSARPRATPWSSSTSSPSRPSSTRSPA
jgi:formate/nitrite transporter